MSFVARIWLVGPGGEVAAALELPREPGPERTPGPADLARWLDALAQRHPGGELVVVGDADLAPAGAALALGVERRALAAGSAALDWPCEGTDLERAGAADGSARGAPQLIGVDLDWVPPLAGVRPRFPGGPGVAGTARG